MSFSRSKKVFFISECLLNQNIRAYGVGNVKGEGPLKEILELFMLRGVGITVVSCPEISYEGLKRSACGIERYDNEIYKKHCVKLANDVIERYKAYLADDYRVGGFICVNGSPSCAIDFCYSENNKCNMPGIFIQELQSQLMKENLSLAFIGIRTKELDKALTKINQIIDSL